MIWKRRDQKLPPAKRKWKRFKPLASSGAATANLLEFNEATTRARIIDSLLATSGWNVAGTTEVGKEIEVLHQPTASGLGYADYVLWDDNGNPLAVIEAKKTAEQHVRSPRDGRP